MKNVTEFSVRYMGYSFFRGAVHMWQRAKSNEQAFKFLKNKSGLCVSFFEQYILLAIS
jgi:hypothetical protein